MLEPSFFRSRLGSRCCSGSSGFGAAELTDGVQADAREDEVQPRGRQAQEGQGWQLRRADELSVNEDMVALALPPRVIEASDGFSLLLARRSL